MYEILKCTNARLISICRIGNNKYTNTITIKYVYMYGRVRNLKLTICKGSGMCLFKVAASAGPHRNFYTTKNCGIFCIPNNPVCV